MLLPSSDNFMIDFEIVFAKVQNLFPTMYLSLHCQGENSRFALKQFCPGGRSAAMASVPEKSFN